MMPDKTHLLISFLAILFIVISITWILPAIYKTNENFQSSATEVKENVSRLFDLKEKRKQFLNSITKVNKEINSLREYYSDIEKIDETN